MRMSECCLQTELRAASCGGVATTGRMYTIKRAVWAGWAGWADRGRLGRLEFACMWRAEILMSQNKLKDVEDVHFQRMSTL